MKKKLRVPQGNNLAMVQAKNHKEPQLYRIITRKMLEAKARVVSQALMDELHYVSWKKKKPVALKKIYNEKYIEDLLARAKANMRADAPLCFHQSAEEVQA